jgi:hypothetical protein
MKELLGVAGAFVFIALLWCLSPLIVLWSINTIAEEASSALYIPHTFWTYICTFLIVVTLRGSSSNK